MRGVEHFWHLLGSKPRLIIVKKVKICSINCGTIWDQNHTRLSVKRLEKLLDIMDAVSGEKQFSGGGDLGLEY